MRKGFSLIEMMISVLIFFVISVGLYYMFAQGNFEIQKAEYVEVATMIAKGEADKVLEPEFYLIQSDDTDWKKLDSSSKLLDQFEYPDDFLDRFEKKVVVKEIEENMVKKIIVSVRWHEIVKQEKQWRQFNYPLIVNNTRQYIYFGD